MRIQLQSNVQGCQIKKRYQPAFSSEVSTEQILVDLRERIKQGEFSKGKPLSLSGAGKKLNVRKRQVEQAIPTLVQEGLVVANPLAKPGQERIPKFIVIRSERSDNEPFDVSTLKPSNAMGFKEVAEQLCLALQQKKHKRGDMLNGVALAQQYGVSRRVLGRAFDDLAREGYIGKNPPTDKGCFYVIRNHPDEPPHQFDTEPTSCLLKEDQLIHKIVGGIHSGQHPVGELLQSPELVTAYDIDKPMALKVLNVLESFGFLEKTREDEWSPRRIVRRPTEFELKLMDVLHQHDQKLLAATLKGLGMTSVTNPNKSEAGATIPDKTVEVLQQALERKQALLEQTLRLLFLDLSVAIQQAPRDAERMGLLQSHIQQLRKELSLK